MLRSSAFSLCSFMSADDMVGSRSAKEWFEGEQAPKNDAWPTPTGRDFRSLREVGPKTRVGRTAEVATRHIFQLHRVCAPLRLTASLIAHDIAIAN
jgi:hypothetical protein